MFRKEWRDLIKPGLFFIAVASIFPSLLILFRIISDLSYAELFFPMCQFGLFFWAFFLGASFLASERYQAGMIYLLSLPYTRLRLLQLKLLPRLTAVLAFFLLYYIFQLAWGKDLVALPMFDFAVIYFALFFIALSLSACSENFLVLFFLSMFSLVAFLGLNLLVIQAALKLKGYSPYELATVDFIVGDLDVFLFRFMTFVGIFLILPPMVSFILTFRRLDVRPTWGYNKRFFRYLGPLLALGLTVSVVWAYSNLNIGYRTFHLTRDHKLVESHIYSDLRIYGGKWVRKIENYGESFGGFIEINGAVYDTIDDRIVRIDLSDYSYKVVYRCPPGRDIHHRVKHYEDSLVFLTRKRNYSARQLEILDVDSGNVDIIPLVPEILSRSSNEEIFAADEVRGRRFWLMLVGRFSLESRVVRIWEDGSTEQIADSYKRPCYVNGMLMTYAADEILISRDAEGHFEVAQSIPNPTGYSFGTNFLHKQDLNNVLIRELYGHKRVQQAERGGNLLYARFDLESLKIQEMENLHSWPQYAGNGEHLYFEEENDSGRPMLKVYKLRIGQLDHLRSFPGVLRGDYNHRVDLFFGDLVIVQDEQVRVFAFPDLRELEFKKLR